MSSSSSSLHFCACRLDCHTPSYNELVLSRSSFQRPLSFFPEVLRRRSDQPGATRPLVQQAGFTPARPLITRPEELPSASVLSPLLHLPVFPGCHRLKPSFWENGTSAIRTSGLDGDPSGPRTPSDFLTGLPVVSTENWLGQLDSNQRRAKASAGVKVRCLTAWRYPITGALLLRSVALQLVSVLVPGSLPEGFSVASGTVPVAMSRIAINTRFVASISFCSSPLSCCCLRQRSGLLE